MELLKKMKILCTTMNLLILLKFDNNQNDASKIIFQLTFKNGIGREFIMLIKKHTWHTDFIGC